MSEVVACLVRVGDNIRKMKNKLIKLDGEQITIGRSGDVDYTILSTMISRCHAIFKLQDGKWTVTDNKSLNGVYVNGRQLVPFKALPMEDGDMVQLGVPTSPDTPAEFLYKFHASLKVRIKRDGAKRRHECSDNQSENAAVQNDSECEGIKKWKGPVPNSSRLNENPEEVSCCETSNTPSKEAEYEAKLAHLERLLHEKEMKQSEVEKQLEKEKLEREKRMKEVEELRLKEQAILCEMQDKQARLEREKEELKRQMQAELEANLQEKEQALISQLAGQKQSLLEEKKRIEQSLHEEVAKALEEKNKEVEERLISMKENLEKVIEKKDNDQKLLEMQLNESKEESEVAKLQALKARDDVLSNFVDLMEMELQCTICSELFIKATALNCAHVFCKLCISQWMKVKKECPNCRMQITSHMQAIALDSYIEKMVEQLSDDHKKSRKFLLDQRKVEQDKLDAGPSTTNRSHSAPGQPSATTIARGRGRNRSGRNNRGRRGRNARERSVNSTGVYTNPHVPGPQVAMVANVGGNNRGAFARNAIINVTGPRQTAIRGYDNAPINTTALPVVPTNPLIMAVASPPIPSAAVQATQTLRSILGLPPSTTSVSTAGLGQSPVLASVASVASNVVIGAAGSDTTPIILDASTSSTANPVEASEATPIEVSDENRSSEEDDDLIYSRYGRQRRYWLEESDTEEEENRDTDEGDNDSDVSVAGVQNEYYGGYGRCFKCGRRGHWANGCPF